MIEEISLRGFVPTDRSYILATSSRHVSSKHLLTQGQRKRFPRFIDALLDDDGVTKVIACYAQDLDHIAGYCLASDEAVIWVYVPYDIRKHGIAREMINAAIGWQPPIRLVFPWPFTDSRFVINEALHTEMKCLI